MNFRQLLLACAVAPGLLMTSGCFWINDDEELKPAPLVDFQASERAQRSWSAQVGSGVDLEGVNLDPALHEGTVFATSTDGSLVAVAATIQIRVRRTFRPRLRA